MNKNSSKTTLYIILALVAAVVGLLVYQANKPSKLNLFAACLKDKGAVFYGAFWCPHCQNQKRLFGNAANNLPYVECSTPDTQGQTQICKDKKIESYPTWIFPDNSRLSGEISLQDLSEKSGCELPQ